MFKAVSSIIDATRGDIDHAGRFAFNTVFGDKVVATRSADIAVMFNYGLSSYDVSTTGTVTAVDGRATLSTGASTSSVATMESVHSVQYFAGDEMYAYFTAAFTQGVEGSLQYIAFESETDGFSIGFKDDLFGITHIRDSAEYNFISRPHFDGDVEDLDVTTLNIYRIGLGYLGIAPITVEWFAGYERGWVVIEIIDLTNQITIPHTTNPIFKIRARVENTTNNTDIQLHTASWRAGVIGSNARKGKTFNAIAEKLALTNGAVFTIRNKTTFNSLTNYISLKLTGLSVATDGNKNYKIYLVKGATLGGTPSFTDILSSESVVDMDSSGTTVSGGTTIFSLGMAKSDNTFVELDKQDILLHPGETLTVHAVTASAGEVVVSVRWRELF